MPRPDGRARDVLRPIALERGANPYAEGSCSRLDLTYAEDRDAQVDGNIVMAEPDRYVEVQATAEGRAFHPPELEQMLGLAHQGISRLFAEQRRVLGW